MHGYPAPPRAALLLYSASAPCPLTRSEIARQARLPAVRDFISLQSGAKRIRYLRIRDLAGTLDLDETDLLFVAVPAKDEPHLHALLTAVIGLPLQSGRKRAARLAPVRDAPETDQHH